MLIGGALKIFCCPNHVVLWQLHLAEDSLSRYA